MNFLLNCNFVKVLNQQDCDLLLTKFNKNYEYKYDSKLFNLSFVKNSEQLYQLLHDCNHIKRMKLLLVLKKLNYPFHLEVPDLILDEICDSDENENIYDDSDTDEIRFVISNEKKSLVQLVTVYNQCFTNSIKYTYIYKNNQIKIVKLSDSIKNDLVHMCTYTEPGHTENTPILYNSAKRRRYKLYKYFKQMESASIIQRRFKKRKLLRKLWNIIEYLIQQQWHPKSKSLQVYMQKFQKEELEIELAYINSYIQTYVQESEIQ
jgi:hypothetical protein